MAHRSRRVVPSLLILALAACSATGVDISTGTTTTLPSTTTSAATPSTTNPATTTTWDPAGIDAEVRVPEGSGPFPTVVLAHGGGWLLGSPSDIRPLASYLTDAGFLTVNARYQLSNRAPGFPQAIDDLACAVRYAANHPDSDGTVTMLGYSAGAHLAALVALTGERYGEDCPFPGSGLPDRFVGLAGIYDVRPLGILLSAFFGAALEDAPDLWSSGNPQELVGANPLIYAYILHGELDRLVNVNFAVGFYEALPTDNGSRFSVIEGADHTAMANPNVVGRLIVEWLRAAAE